MHMQPANYCRYSSGGKIYSSYAYVTHILKSMLGGTERFDCSVKNRRTGVRF